MAGGDDDADADDAADDDDDDGVNKPSTYECRSSGGRGIEAPP